MTMEAGAPETKPAMTKICVMDGVHEYEEEDAVELWRYGRRLLICAKNESGNRRTAVDLWDVIGWISRGNRRMVEDLFIVSLIDALEETKVEKESQYDQNVVQIARIAKLEKALQYMLAEWDKFTRYGSPMAKAANERVAFARTTLEEGTQPI